MVRLFHEDHKAEFFTDRIGQLKMIQPEADHRDEELLVGLAEGVKFDDRVGLSAGAGTRLKEELLETGWVDGQVVETGRSRKLLLRLSTEARKALGTEAPNTNASIAHEYWKRFYARRFSNEGYDVEVEAACGDGRVDVLARRNGESVAIEVETGKSDVVANVKRALAEKFDRVVIVATDEVAYKKVERALAAAGLLIDGRVSISDRLELLNGKSLK